MTLLDAALWQADSPSTCAPAVESAVREWRAKGYPGATATTKRLLAHWFDTDHIVDGLPFEFYAAQRDAVEALIFVYEIMKRRDNKTLLEAFLPNPYARLLQHGDFARYGVKMATGSGKTMVMALSVVWSYLNALREPNCAEYAVNFLIIAPNVIVFERLQSDFAGGAVFRKYPMLPPEFAADWDNMRFFMRGDSADIASRGALYLTNIQQLYDAPQKRRRSASGGRPAAIAGFLGSAASDAPEQRDDFDDRIERRRSPCMIINDEAHHTHDEDSEWNNTIRRLRDRIGGARFMAQLDFTATPRFNTDGSLFPWVICDYPLKRAIEDGIVKQPIRGEVHGVGEAPSSDAAVRYEAYITAAVNRWREYRDELKPLGKKPVLFAMMENTKDANAVGEYLRQTHADEFGGDKLQVIHIGRDGEVSNRDLDRARSVVKNIDSAASSVNAVVSVMMLREGWDVRNVTVVLGLRPYTSKANILPEQAIGRGLRLMFPGEAGMDSGYEERVDIIGTEKFMEFVSNLEQLEGIAVQLEDIETTPIRIVSVYPDKAKSDMDIAIPTLTPIYERAIDTREQIANLDIAEIQPDAPPFSLAPQDDTQFEYLGLDALTDEVELRRQYTLSSPNTCGEVVSYYASRIADELNLPGHFDVIADKLRAYLSERAFGQPIDLDDNAHASALAKPAVGYLAVQGFTAAVRPMLRQEQRPTIGAPALRLADTQPFPWSRPTCEASKTVFNLVAADNDFELEFARFLQAAPDVARFAKLPLKLGFKIQYIANTGNIRHYYPDFVAVDADGQRYLIETKGQEDTNVANKDRAANLWCRNATELTGTDWRFVKVAQIDFSELAGRTLSDIAQAFGRQTAL